MWWKKKRVIEEKKEVSLLEELCGDDTKLYSFLSTYLLVNPLDGVSKHDIDILTEQAEKSGNFRPAVEKAIFEATQNLEERERYIEVIQNLASKTTHATEQEKEKAEKEGNTARATSLERIIDNQKFLSERIEDVLKIASVFYSEKLLELGEGDRRVARGIERQRLQSEELAIKRQEEAERLARKEDRKKMGKEERREAEEQEKREELAADERRAARARDREEAEAEEQRIGMQEETDRQTRRDERQRNK